MIFLKSQSKQSAKTAELFVGSGDLTDAELEVVVGGAGEAHGYPHGYPPKCKFGCCGRGYYGGCRCC